MYLPSLLSLPPAIIALLCATSTAAESQWPHNVPKHLKYFPEDEVHVKRAVELRERLQHEKPIGMKKMSLDEGEMFMLSDWIFASDAAPPSSKKAPDSELFENGTSQALPPLRPISGEDYFARMHIRDVLLKRQFKCPDGTTSCESIGSPDVCCGTGSSCLKLDSNSDAGSVGCCPEGDKCAGSVSCDEASGYTSCPNADNGGCCLPGFKCQGIGCVFEGTSTTYIQPSTSSTPTPSSSSSTESSTAVVVVPTSPSTSSTPKPTTSSTSERTCSTGWFSCPASLGGGCCMNGRTCATGASCLGDDVDPSSTRAPDAPVRPTSGSVTTTASATSNDDDICPQGFYVCSAFYPSGCCRVGRDCQTTGSCALPTETVLNTNGVVVVAPSGAAAGTTGASEGGSCPSAWFSCPANQGGDCCPDGYRCGDQCTATASGETGVEDKVAPSTASFVSAVGIWGMMFGSVFCGIAMIVL